jgi:uncharacterized protein (UPF0332 family)
LEFTPDMSQRMFNQILEIWILPELKRRQEAGLLDERFELKKAQIIFYSNGKKPEVRINSEAKALANLKLKKGISKNAGDPIYSNEVEDLADIKLSSEEDPDCGHLTIIGINDKWFIGFDFRYNKGLATKHIETAKQFYSSAKFSFDKNHMSACLDNLFSAAELAAKAELLLMTDPKLKESSHGGIQVRYNKYAELGNVEPELRKALNKLSAIRESARYLKYPLTLSNTEIEVLLKNVEGIIIHASKRLTYDKESPH